MRIAIVGDLQYEKGESISGIIDDINTLNPDNIIFLGDYGYFDGYGSPENFMDFAVAFKKLNCKNYIPLLGNHDWPWESGGRKLAKGTVISGYTKAFGYPPKNRFLDFGTFCVFCINIDSPEMKDFKNPQECYVSDADFAEIKAELEKVPDKPVIMITHAPPVGCALLTAPEVHIRYCNGYLDQKHDYTRWAELALKYRKIIMWLCGHYHIGHRHDGSMSIRDGLAYFLTGSATSLCRDGQRHTRVIDFDGKTFRVRTYDHDKKVILEDDDYICGVKIRGAAELPTIEGEFSAGCGRVVKNGLKSGKGDTVYAMTDNGYLWEINLLGKAALGTLHFSEKYKLDGFETDGVHVWRRCGGHIFRQVCTDPKRFMRQCDYKDCNFTEVDESDIRRHDDITECGGRPACTVGEYICTSYNDVDGRLYFEVTKKR